MVLFCIPIYLQLVILSASGVIAPEPGANGAIGGHGETTDLNFLLNLNPTAREFNPTNWNGHAISPSRPAAGIDRRGRIKCDGDFPPFEFPDSVRTLYANPVELCGHEEYGGKRGASIGAYCAWFHKPSPRIVFDKTRASPFWYRDAPYSRRAFLYCQSHCKCASRVSESVRRPINIRKKPIAYVIDPGASRDWELPVRRIDSLFHMLVLQYPLAKVSGASTISYDAIVIAGTGETQVTCEGPFEDPRANLPASRYMPPEFRDTEYPNIRSLCAAEMHGGMTGMNTGGMCLPFPHPDGPRSYNVPLEFSAHELSVNNMPYGLTVQLWCHQHCYCTLPRRDNPRPDPVVRWLFNGKPEFKDGGCTYRAWVKLSGSEALFVITAMPSGQGLANADGNAQANIDPCERGSCATVWPSTMPTPPTPVYPVHGIEAEGVDAWRAMVTPAAEKYPVCGRGCHTNAECSTGGSDCRCVANPLKVPMQPGVQRMSWATCLSLSVYFAYQEVLSKPRRIGMRSTPGWIPQCACNETYVSQRCCDSSTGIISEDAGGSRGTLTRQEVAPDELSAAGSPGEY